MDHGVFSATSSVRGRFNPVVTVDSQLGNILLSGSGEATGGLNSPPLSSNANHGICTKPTRKNWGYTLYCHIATLVISPVM